MSAKLLLVLSVLAVSAAAQKYYCYVGSNLYQEATQDCTEKDPSYNGTWYCSKITVCEPYINKNRECIVTRGCATKEQCTDSTSGGVWDGQDVYMTNGIKPAGMSMSLTCCETVSTPTDDAAVIDYAAICNSSSKLLLGYSTIVISLFMSMYLFLA